MPAVCLNVLHQLSILLRDTGIQLEACICNLFFRFVHGSAYLVNPFVLGASLVLNKQPFDVSTGRAIL